MRPWRPVVSADNGVPRKSTQMTVTLKKREQSEV